MLQVTRYAMFKILVSEGKLDYNHVRKLLLLIIPRATYVAPSSSPEDLYEEYVIVADEIKELCPNSVSVVNDEISVGWTCRKLLEERLKRFEDRESHIPRLIRIYLEGVDHVIPSSTFISNSSLLVRGV